MGYLFDDDYSKIPRDNEFWIKVCFGILIFYFTLKWLVKWCKKRSSKVEEETPGHEIVVGAVANHIELIASSTNKTAEKPPSYDLATKENLPPPKYEDIVTQK